MQSQLLYFSLQRSSPLLKISRWKQSTHYHLEKVPVWTLEVWCSSLSQHTSGHHKLRKPPHALRPFLRLAVLPWGEIFGRIPPSNRLRENWVGPACPTGIKYYLYSSSPHSCYIPRYVKQVSYLFNKYVLNVCCGPGALPGVQRWNVKGITFWELPVQWEDRPTNWEFNIICSVSTQEARANC